MTARAGARSIPCIRCQWRTFSTSYARLAGKETKPSSQPARAAPQEISGEAPAQLSNAPRAYGKRVDEFTPTSLSRPIGMNYPPVEGENTGIDFRSLKQRRDDFVNYEKHLARREQLKSQISRPYFREWSNIDLHKGKTFIAPPRLFRGDLSLYFPNLHGDTIAKRDNLARDTTAVLEGKASIVSVFANVWAQNQVDTLVSKKANPELHSVVEQSGGMAQFVQVNSEDNALRNWLIWLFKRSVRKQVGKENWHRYFIVRKGISDEIRESIGLLNSKVGYTYLVDHECRIRWAASGPSLPDERQGLAKGVRRLLDEMAKQGVGEGYVRKSLVKAAPKQDP